MPTEREKLLRVLRCLDLTNLDEGCEIEDIHALCAAAQGPNGNVAAVCIWPRFVSEAARILSGSSVRIATVVNFPDGTSSLERVLDEAGAAYQDGATEIDLVVPWQELLRGNDWDIQEYVAALHKSLPGATIKAILETGEVRDPNLIRTASLDALVGGAQFLKTSTGKTGNGATPEAVDVMIDAVREMGDVAGIKVSGGVRSVSAAVAYLEQVEAGLGTRLGPDRFRIGASALLKKLRMSLSR